MEQALAVARWVVAGGFVVLGVTSVSQWAKYRDRPRGVLAAALSSLAVVAVIGRVNDATDDRYELLGHAALFLFMASGVLLLLFRHTFAPLSRGVMGGALAAAVLAVAAILAAGPEVGTEAEYSSLELAALAGLILVWSACVGEPAIQLWRKARGLPMVQRARLKSLSLGYGGLILLVFVAVFGRTGAHPNLDLARQAGALALIPILLVSFAPPAWLRRSWREKEEEQIGLVEDLAIFSLERGELAQRAVDRAVRMMGASAGFLSTDDGKVMAARELDDESAERLATDGSSSLPRLVQTGDQRRVAIVVDVPTRDQPYRLGVVSGPITPLFGTEEVERLGDYGSLVGVVLDRVRLVDELRDETNRYQSLLQAISDLGEGFVITEAGRCVYANEAYCRMTGYRLEELQGLDSLLDLTHPDDRAVLTDRLQSRMAGEEVPELYETRLVRKDGRVVECEIAVKLYESGEGKRLVSIVRDIDERKQIDRFRTEFIANAAHELRTPVTAIMGFASLIAERHDIDPAKSAELLVRIRRQSERLRRLIADLLDLGALQRGRRDLAPKKIWVADLANGVLEAMPPPEPKRVHLEVPDDLVAFVDPSGLDDVLTNLLSNAYRYGGDEIRIRGRSEKDTVLIAVSDDGPGVPAEMVPRLFDAFTRGPGSSAAEGAGLGLAIVRHLVEALGGDIWYESGDPQGARFNLRLPRPS